MVVTSIAAKVTSVILLEIFKLLIYLDNQYLFIF